MANSEILRQIGRRELEIECPAIDYPDDLLCQNENAIM